MEERGIDADNGEPAPVTETLEEIERRHKAEVRKLEGETRALMKTAKKSTKAQIETQIIQMQYDMKARHQEEMDAWEASGGDANIVQNVSATVTDEPEQAEVAPSEEEIAALKKAKAKKKQDKKKSKDEEKTAARLQLEAENSGPSRRDIELGQLNTQLAGEQLQVKPIISDGNCLYRAIADQLQLVAPSTEEDFNTLRGVAADYLRAHAEDFCPFLGMELGDPEYDAYCAKVASLTQAEWGGQLEIKAISAALQRPILVYSANAPVLCMNDAEASLEDVPPLRITFHRHYFALGEHYNSVMPMS